VHVTTPAKKLKQSFEKGKEKKIEKRETSSDSEPHQETHVD
jgi:hypothetical protein